MGWFSRKEPEAAEAPALAMPVAAAAPAASKVEEKPAAEAIHDNKWVSQFVAAQAEVNQPSRWSWNLFNWLPPLNLPNPGKFEELNREEKVVLSDQELFDGVKFEYIRQVSPTLQLSHTIQMGSQNDPPTYYFSPMYQHKETVMVGRCGTDFSVMGRVFHSLNDRVKLLGTVQTSPDPHLNAVSTEFEYRGDDYTWHSRYHYPSTMSTSWMQSLTKRLALGAEMLYDHNQMASMYSIGGRYDTGKWIGALQANPAQGHAVMSFTRKVTEKVSFTTKFEAGLNPHTAGIEQIWCLGWQYALRLGAVRGQITSRGRIFGYYEESLNENTRFTLSGDIDYAKSTYKFGVGFTFGM